MARLVIAVLSFGVAFVLAVAILIAVHSFFADVPIEPLLGMGGVAVLLCFFLGQRHSALVFLLAPSITRERCSN